MSSDQQQPEWLKQLTEAITGFGKELEKVGPILIAQGAFGWMMRGDIEAARADLAKLPVEQLQAVSLAASALTSLADEVAGEKSER